MENILPKVGYTYKFYDDGKITPSRQYDATVLRIISKEEAKTIMFPLYCCEDSDYEVTTIVYEDETAISEKSLYDIWKEEAKHYDWLYATDTDYFIECSIPKYDKYPIWFIKTQDGGWFSMDIQNSWQSGRLDVDNSLTEELKEWINQYEKEFKTKIKLKDGNE